MGLLINRHATGSAGIRRGRRELRSKFQKTIWSVLFLAAYLAAAMYFLIEAEAPGDDTNILMLLGGAIIATGAGAWLAPIIPKVLGLAPRLSSRRSSHRRKSRL